DAPVSWLGNRLNLDGFRAGAGAGSTIPGSRSAFCVGRRHRRYLYINARRQRLLDGEGAWQSALPRRADPLQRVQDRDVANGTGDFACSGSRAVKIDRETRRPRDKETGRQGEGGIFTSPCLPVSLSPCLLQLLPRSSQHDKLAVRRQEQGADFR